MIEIEERYAYNLYSVVIIYGIGEGDLEFCIYIFCDVAFV